MVQEREDVVGPGGASAGSVVDPVKRGQGVLSFRSRKLLQSRLSKSSSGGATGVDKAAIAAASEACIRREQGGSLSAEAKTPDARGQTVDGRRLRNQRTVSRASGNEGSAQYDRKAGKQRPVSFEGKQGKENKKTLSSDGIVVESSTRQLPPKLKLLETFYEAVEAALSLLRIRHQTSTFKEVCKVVESMSKRSWPKVCRKLESFERVRFFRWSEEGPRTLSHAYLAALMRTSQRHFARCLQSLEFRGEWSRRFLLKHLAQIKHLFPEVMQLDYVRCQDPDSWDEKWDLRISLLPFSSVSCRGSTPLKGSVGQAGATIRRRKEFRARLHSFASEHTEGVEVPQDPLPSRPFGGQLPKPPPCAAEQDSSSASPLVASSSPRDQNCQPEAAAETDSDTEATPSIGTEEFEFSIVKPSRANEPILDGGSSHFPAFFKPYFSVQQKSTSLVDGVCARDSDAVEADDSHVFGCHFPITFRPFFSVLRGDETSDCHPQQPSEPPTDGFSRGSCSNDLENDLCPASSFESDVGDRLLLPSSAPSDPPHPAATVCHFSPSFTPKFSAGTENRSSGGNSEGTPKLPPSERFFSPVPTHTPIYRSPGNDCLRPAQESSEETPSSKGPELGSSGQPRYQSTVRSLRFGSPIKAFTKEESVPSEIATTTPSAASVTPVHENPSAPSCNPRLKAAYDGQSSAFALPSSVQNTLSPERTSISQSLQFSTPTKNFGTSSTSLEATVPIAGQFRSPISEGGKPPRYVSPGKSMTFSSPKTPSFVSPVRTTDTKQVLYSPPKRTKLSRGNLFDVSDEKYDSRTSSVQEVVLESKSVSKASERSPADDTRQHEIASSTSTVKRTQSIPESDLDIIHSLPLDLVQSVQENEEKLKYENSKELAKQRWRQQMMSGVPKLFNQLRLIFQSQSRSVLPQHELLKSILSSNCDITDKGEVEARLKLLVELAPDYITTRSSHKGELLYRIDKRAEVGTIQKRISCACQRTSS